MDSKHLVIIQCRLGSQRLPSKALYPIQGEPCLVYLIKNLQANLSPDQFQIILATTEDQENNILVTWAQMLQIEVFRGDQDNVYKRYWDLLQKYPCQDFTRVTADNPLTSTEFIESNVQAIRSQDLDYIQTKNVAIGSGVDSFNTQSFLQQLPDQLTPAEQEHINKYILDHPQKFKIAFHSHEHDLSHHSCTVDSIEDYHHVIDLIYKLDLKIPFANVNKLLE